MNNDALRTRINALWEADRIEGTSGRFPVPAHVAALIAALAAPRPTDTVCDPCAGTCDLLVAAADYVCENFPATLRDPTERKHFHGHMFHGFGADKPMLTAGARLVKAHGVKHADIRPLDVIAQAIAEHEAAYSLVLCRLPFAGSVDSAQVAKDLLRRVRTKRIELLTLARITQMLSPGGRAALIVPDGLLSGASKGHIDLRSKLVDEHKVEAVIKLPAGVFKPYMNAAAAILLFTRTENAGTQPVWFYDVRADGFTLDTGRTPLLAAEKLGVKPQSTLTSEDHACNNLPDLLARWQRLHNAPVSGDDSRSAQSFCVPQAEIAAQGYDLSLDRYKLPEPTHTETRRPHEILAELAGLEAEIFQAMKDIVGMLK
jgi:type I restriction enzyme M protein